MFTSSFGTLTMFNIDIHQQYINNRKSQKAKYVPLNIYQMFAFLWFFSLWVSNCLLLYLIKLQHWRKCTLGDTSRINCQWRIPLTVFLNSNNEKHFLYWSTLGNCLVFPNVSLTLCRLYKYLVSVAFLLNWKRVIICNNYIRLKWSSLCHMAPQTANQSVFILF